MRRRKCGWCVLVAAVLVGARSASAQDTPVLVSASYDVFYHEFAETSAVGAHLDVAKVFGLLAGVGEVGFNRFPDATVISVSGGGRLLLARPASGAKIEPAVQFLAGLWKCNACDFNELFIQPGFLVDIPRSPTFRIRLAFDFRRILFDFGGENAERASVGAVWAF